MKIIKNPWSKEFLSLVNQSYNSIKITSPFIKNDFCLKMIDSKRESAKIEVITSFKLVNILNGSLDLSAIENIISNEGVVKNYSRLHAKSIFLIILKLLLLLEI